MSCSEAEMIFLGCLKISWTDPPVCVSAECPPWAKNVSPVVSGLPNSRKHDLLQLTLFLKARNIRGYSQVPNKRGGGNNWGGGGGNGSI